jgi:hypothetical protein
MMHQAKATWLAYNRRVGVILEPAGRQSSEAFPNDAPDARILWQRSQPSLQQVKSASNPASNTEVNTGGTEIG